MLPCLSRRALLTGFAVMTLGSRFAYADTPRAAQTVELTILHTNDTHGHLLPYSYPEIYPPYSDLSRLAARQNIGGAARRASLVKRIRAEKGHQTLLIDAGDICDGTPFSTEYSGDADIAVMNALGYDIACPGNHEFSPPLAQVRKMIATAKFPYLCANVTDKATGKPLYTPYVIKEVGGAKIAFLGLMTYDARTYRAAREGLEMEPPIDVAKRLVPELRKQADLVICVNHIGVDVDRMLAASVPGIDVIVGGHSHTLLPAPLFLADKPSTNPLAVNGTVIVQDFQWGGTLGRLDLTLARATDGRWAVKKYAGRLLPVTSTVPEDPQVAAVVSTFWKPIAPKYAAVVGQAADDFAEKGSDHAEYHLVADAVREGLNLEFDIENMGGVRAPLTKGAISFGDVVSLDPFGNTIVTFRATGRQIKEILSRNRPAVSGIRYVMDGGRLLEATLNGKPLEDEHIYSGATNSYYAPFILKEITDKTDTKTPRLDMVLQYLKKHAPVQPAYDGRRILRNMEDTGG